MAARRSAPPACGSAISMLTVNGTSTSGTHVLPGVHLGPDRIGSAVEVGLLRDGNRLTARLIVAAHPE